MNLDFLLSCVVYNTAFEAVPAGADSPSLGDDKIREFKQAFRERFEKEHKMDLSSGTLSADGWHKQGSALTYYAASAPTLRPDGITSLNALDYGRLWYNTSSGLTSTYTASGWVASYGSAKTTPIPDTVILRDASGDASTHVFSVTGYIVAVNEVFASGGNAVLSTTPGPYATGTLSAYGVYTIPAGTYYVHAGGFEGTARGIQVYASGAWRNVAVGPAGGENCSMLVHSDGTNYRVEQTYGSGYWETVQVV